MNSLEQSTNVLYHVETSNREQRSHCFYHCCDRRGGHQAAPWALSTDAGHLLCVRFEVDEATLVVHCFAGAWLDAWNQVTIKCCSAAENPQCVARSCLTGNVILFKHRVIHSS